MVSKRLSWPYLSMLYCVSTCRGNDVKLAVARGTLDVLEKTYGGDLAGY